MLEHQSAPPQSPLILQSWHNPILPLAPHSPGAGRACWGVLGHSLHLGHTAEPFVSPRGAETWLSQVIKHRLCRRGKCRKNHKRNNTDKGVALSMDDVKRHVSAAVFHSGGGVTLLGTRWGKQRQQAEML